MGVFGGLTYGRKIRKINPYEHIELRAKMDYRVCNGDRAALNGFVHRGAVTIGRMEEVHALLTEGIIPRKIAHWELLDLVGDIEVSFNMLTDEEKEEVREKYKEVLGL